MVLLSDMVQFANGIRLGSVERWTPSELSGLLEDAPTIDLTGVRIYVVGAGATTTTDLASAQIEGIGSFWSRWFERSGAQVEFYGANLARFPIEEVAP